MGRIRPLVFPPKILRFQYASQLAKPLQSLADSSHWIQPKAPHLLLCGNIGYWKLPQTQTFFKTLSPKFETIVWIPAQEDFSLEEEPWKTLDSMREMGDNIGNVVIGTKMQLWFPQTNVSLLATTGSKTLPKIASKVLQNRASLEALRCMGRGEQDWLLRCSMLHDGTLVSATHDMFHPAKTPRIHVFGEGPNVSGNVSQGIWTTCNSAIHPGFVKQAIFDVYGR